MKNSEINQIAAKIKNNSNENIAFFGFTEYTEQEFCIKANHHGLKLFAAMLLELSTSSNNEIQSLNSEKLPWIKDDLGIEFISLTNENRENITSNIEEHTSVPQYISLLLVVIGLVLLYLITAGIIFTIKLL